MDCFPLSSFFLFVLIQISFHRNVQNVSQKCLTMTHVFGATNYCQMTFNLKTFHLKTEILLFSFNVYILTTILFVSSFIFVKLIHKHIIYANCLRALPDTHIYNNTHICECIFIYTHIKIHAYIHTQTYIYIDI